MIKKYRKNKLKGSVLYTVVAVMMIMTVFVFAALTLASAANRRAFNSYANNQTQYTARSVVDSMMKILRENGSAAVGELTPDELNILNNSIDSSMGKVTSAKIESIGTIKELEAKNYNFGLNLTEEQKNNYVYKLSATVKMLGQENTVSLYCYNGKEDNPPLFKNALTIMGNTDFRPCNTIPVYGDVYTSIDDPVDVIIGKGNSQPLYINGTYGTQGNLILYGGGNGGLIANIDDFNKGIYVEKNVYMFDSSMRNKLSFTKDVNNVSYTTLPYAFINGTFDGYYVDSEGKTTGTQYYMTIGDINHPFIFMADSLGRQGSKNQFNAYADVYLYSDTTPSYIMVNSESSGNESGVHSWNTGKVDTANPDGKEYIGGNIYSMGELNVETYNQGSDSCYGGTLANNVVAKSVNFSGHGWSTMNYKTIGAVVADSFNSSSPAGSSFNYTFSGGLFTNLDNFNIAAGQTVNGISYVEDYIQYNVEKVMLSGKREITDDVNNQQAQQVNLTNAGTGSIIIPYDFSNDFSEAVFNKVYSWGNTNNVTIEEFKIDISAIEELKGNGCKIGCEIVPLNGSIQKFDISYDFDNGTLSIPGYYFWSLNSIKGYIRLQFYPYDTYTEDEGKYISVNSVSVVLDVDIRRTGDIKVSGTDKLELLKQANDNAFAWNSNTIYIDDIDKSVKLVKDGNKMVIYTANNDSSAYTLVGEYDYNDNTQYINFLNKVVETVTFPDSMKKDKVIDTNGGFVSTSFKSESFRKQIVSNAKTYADVESELKDVNTYLANHTDWTKVDKDGNISSVTIDKSNPITENCILGCTSSNRFGNGSNGVLYIDPPANKTIYIGLYNFKVYSNTHIVVVDDDNGKVNFFVPKSGIEINGTGKTTGNGIDWTVTNNVSVMPESLYNKLYDDSGNMTSAKIDINELTVKSPNIYFYFDNDEELNMTLGDGSLIAGYIYGPNVNYYVKSGAYFSNGAFNINILGSGIFKSAYIQSSNYVYIEEGSTAETPSDGSDVGLFTKLYYQAY